MYCSDNAPFHGNRTIGSLRERKREREGERQRQRQSQRERQRDIERRGYLKRL